MREVRGLKCTRTVTVLTNSNAMCNGNQKLCQGHQKQLGKNDKHACMLVSWIVANVIALPDVLVCVFQGQRSLSLYILDDTWIDISLQRTCLSILFN